MNKVTVARINGCWMVATRCNQFGFSTLSEAMTFAYETADRQRIADGATHEGLQNCYGS